MIASTNSNQRACPVCDSKNSTALYRNDFAKLAGLDLSYTVDACGECGFIFSNQLPGDEVYSQYYSRFSKYDVYDTMNKIPRIDIEVADVTVDYLNSMNLNFDSVYDVGCSIGVMLGKLRQQRSALTVKGIDPSPNSRPIARALFDVDVETGFYKGDKSLEEFDLICSSSVLEHIKDVKTFVSDIARNSRQGSHVMFLVPSLNDFQFIEGEWLGELSTEHINYFNEFSIDNLLSRFGYDKVDCRRIKLSNGQFILIYLGKLSESRSHSLSGNADATGKESMQNYLGINKKLIDRLMAKMGDAGGSYCFFGAGAHTMRMLKLPRVFERPPQAIFDSNKNIQGQFLDNFEIRPPSDLSRIAGDNAVIISSYKGIPSIKGTIESTGFKGRVIELY